MKKISILLSIILLSACLFGCSSDKNQRDQGEYDIYYINREETALVKEAYSADSVQTDDLIKELLGAMQITPKQEKEHFVLLSDSVNIVNYRYDGTNVELNMTSGYNDVPITKEVLIRAGLVRTLVQIEGVDTVSILVSGLPLCNSKGVQIGKMNARSFIENSGKEINAYKTATLTLYFTNETGTELIEETRKLYYNSNVSLEQTVIEQLIKGSKLETNYPTIPSTTKILSVTVVDNICYVNVNEAFVKDALMVQQEIPIYSIANSLIDSCSVNAVQIFINGESNMVFRESMSLSEFYHMNRDIIQNDIV